MLVSRNKNANIGRAARARTETSSDRTATAYFWTVVEHLWSRGSALRASEAGAGEHSLKDFGRSCCLVPLGRRSDPLPANREPGRNPCRPTPRYPRPGAKLTLRISAAAVLWLCLDSIFGATVACKARTKPEPVRADLVLSASVLSRRDPLVLASRDPLGDREMSSSVGTPVPARVTGALVRLGRDPVRDRCVPRPAPQRGRRGGAIETGPVSGVSGRARCHGAPQERAAKFQDVGGGAGQRECGAGGARAVRIRRG
jgi:hypothetical protein